MSISYTDKNPIPTDSNNSIIKNQPTTNSKKYLGYEVSINNKVKPTKSCLAASWPCEKTNAAIRNKAVTAVDNNDTAMVACRYLQARKGQKSTRKEAIFACLSFNIIGHGHVNIRNTLRYKKTKRGCKTYLINNLGLDKYREIQKIQYSEKGLRKLRTTLPKNLFFKDLDNKIDRYVYIKENSNCSTFANNCLTFAGKCVSRPFRRS